ncbi:MAG: diaminopimelate epimerase [Deltaproteobacteria bacterium]|nr:diaminopimelate epimerase [Deltaproteobacteria bacterium]
MPTLPFTKMHGTGNDFVMVDARDFSEARLKALRRNASRIGDRHFGVGFDQMIIVRKPESKDADLRMEIINQDGSIVEMCGNGIRCFALYVRDRKIMDKPVLNVETPAGIIRPRIADGLVEVDMGEPVLDGRRIPVNVDGEIRDRTLTIAGEPRTVTCVSMGNPHCVSFVQSVEAAPVTTLGPKIEHDPLFPRRINAEFAEIVDKGTIRLRVWERGAGETLACGTGACATAVAAAWTGRTGRNVTVKLPGGDLRIRWDESSNRVFMTGPATTVFEGSLELPDGE